MQNRAIKLNLSILIQTITQILQIISNKLQISWRLQINNQIIIQTTIITILIVTIIVTINLNIAIIAAKV